MDVSEYQDCYDLLLKMSFDTENLDDVDDADKIAIMKDIADLAIDIQNEAKKW